LLVGKDEKKVTWTHACEATG